MRQELIVTERLTLRRLRPQDLKPWDNFFLSDRARFVGGGREVSPDLSWRVFATFLGHWDLSGTGPFAIVMGAEADPVGMAGPWLPRGWPERELTWSLWDQSREGQGLASEAVHALRRYVHKELGWDRAVSYVDPANERSIKLCRSLGCTEDPSLSVPDEDETLTFVHPRWEDE